MNDTVDRGYRYALLLTPGQEAALARQESQLRYAWNKLVNWHRCALRDWSHGRQTDLLGEYRDILTGKNGNTGQASPMARRNALIRREAAKVAEQEKIKPEEALARLIAQGFEPQVAPRDEVIAAKIQALQHGRLEQALQSAKKLAKEKSIPQDQALEIVKGSGYGANGTGTGPRRLSVELAQERLMARANHFYGGQKCLLYGLIQKFQKSCENWLTLAGTAQAPRPKKAQDKVACQRQILKKYRWAVGRLLVKRIPEIRECDLSVMLGQAGTRCRVVWHRPLPDEASIKQLAITGRPGKRMLVIFFKCPRQSVVKPFAPSLSRAGIETGYSCALTVVSNAYIENRKARREAHALDIELDQKLFGDPDNAEGIALGGALGNLERYLFSNNGALELQPRLARDTRFLKKLRRLQRKMDRQKRLANPDCLNPNGTWKKGKRAKNLTQNLIKTHKKIQQMHECLTDSRRDFYHVTCFNLLKEHGHVVVGDWRPPALHKQSEPAKPGLAKKRRNMNRKGLDHAISSFESILKDKASLAANPRIVEIVHEAYTTRTCACCKAETGPQEPTSIVAWTCSNCGAENHRKANAAENIRRISAGKTTVTAGAQPVVALV